MRFTPALRQKASKSPLRYLHRLKSSSVAAPPLPLGCEGYGPRPKPRILALFLAGQRGLLGRRLRCCGQYCRSSVTKKIIGANTIVLSIVSSSSQPPAVLWSPCSCLGRRSREWHQRSVPRSLLQRPLLRECSRPVSAAAVFLQRAVGVQSNASVY